MAACGDGTRWAYVEAQVRRSGLLSDAGDVTLVDDRPDGMTFSRAN